MVYTVTNYKTKKALKEDLKAGKKIEVFQPGMGSLPDEGEVSLEGPHYPAPHTWYARAKIKNGVITKVIG